MNTTDILFNKKVQPYSLKKSESFSNNDGFFTVDLIEEDTMHCNGG